MNYDWNDITAYVCATVVAIVLICSSVKGCAISTEADTKKMESNNNAYVECIKSVQKPLECRMSVYGH